MTEDEKRAAINLITGIDKMSSNLGLATRELRDKVEFTSQEVSVLSSEINSASQRHKEIMESLIAALNRNSESSDKWAFWMVVLTLVLASATVISAIYPILFHN